MSTRRPRQQQEPPFGVLFVCTGNVCRSPMAERLVRARVAGTGGAVQALSAGTRAVAGAEMHPQSARVLQGLGGDPAGFLARQIQLEDVMGADLVLTMTRDHRRSVLEMAPRALSRTFTLREAAALTTLVGPDDVQAAPGAAELDGRRGLVRALAAFRSRHRAGPEDDVADPIGGPPHMHDEAGQAIAEALGVLLERFGGLQKSAGRASAAGGGQTARRAPSGAGSPVRGGTTR